MSVEARLRAFQAKCAHNEILAADLRKAVSIPSKSILFNIDQKADVISKGRPTRCFPFPEGLRRNGRLLWQAAAHRASSSATWTVAKCSRRSKMPIGLSLGNPGSADASRPFWRIQNVAKAYAQATGAQPSEGEGILTRVSPGFPVVDRGLRRKGKGLHRRPKPGFRLNFFVDEVGQYIADNVKLMTNLKRSRRA